MIVAFFGPSSSGKTTLLKEVKKLTLFSDKKVIFKKEDDFITIRILKSILGNKLFSDYKRIKFFEKKPRTNLRVFSLFVNFFYPLLVYIEFFWEYFYYEVLFREKVLMKDRYIYDYFVTFKDILKIRSAPMIFFYRTFPKPSLLFYIRINKETAMKRNKNNFAKKITSKESFHARVLESYTEIANAKNVLIVDNNGPIEKSIHTLKSHILAREKLLRLRSIAIIGLDGSGKSSLAKKISNYATQLNVKCTIAHFYHDNILYKLLKILGFFRTDTGEVPAENVKKKKTSLWAFLTWIDSYVQYLSILVLFGRGRSLIIFDRYFYDYLVTFSYMEIRGLSLFKRAIPSVGYKLLLNCEPKIALKRKPENTLDFFVQGSKAYSKIAQEYNMKVINSSSSKHNSVFGELIHSIMKDANNEL